MVVSVPAIGGPLPGIAQHSVEPKRIGRKTVDVRVEAIVPLAAATVAIGVVLADGVAPHVAAGGERVVAARLFASPRCRRGVGIAARADVDEQITSKLSMMPEDLEKQLRPQEIIDLLAYLSLDRPPEDAKARKIPGTPR